MKILYAVILGALAGIVSWFILSLPFIDQASPILKPVLRGLVLGVIFGGILGVLKRLGDKSSGRILPGVLDSLVLGVTGGVASQLLILGLGSTPDKNTLFSIAGWVIFGLFLGAGQRLDKPSAKGIIYSVIGGVAGGGLGGIALDYLSKGSFKTAWWGQAFGMTIMGIALGAAINAILFLVEKESKKATPAKPVQSTMPISPVAQKPEFKAVPSKPATTQPLKKWLEANFLIEKTQITIGSSPDNDIIIRAPEIEPKQALVNQEKGRFLIRNIGTSKEIFVSFTGDLIQGRNLAINEFNALKEGSAIKLKGESLMFFHVSPPSISVRYPIDKARIIIGTSPQNDIVIKDASASSRHAQISWEGQRGLVIDMGSSSGTYVSYSGDKAQERRIPEKNAINNNSLIRIGNVTFRVLG